MKTTLARTAVACAVFFPASGHALEWSDLNGFAGLGYEFGGETYARGTYAGSGIPANANVNEGLRLMVGASIANNAAKTFETQVSFGYKFGGPYGERSGITWNAMPLEVMEYYRSGDWRGGFGLAYHVDTHADFQGVDQPTQTFRVNNALGYVVSMTYAPPRYPYVVEGRYTIMRQGFADDPSREKFNASVFGMFLHYRF
jgi:hypothetical protein